MGVEKIHGLVSGLLNFTTFTLVAIAVTSIVVFFKVFKSDFSQD